jgi:hypothetical protein
MLQQAPIVTVTDISPQFFNSMPYIPDIVSDAQIYKVKKEIVVVDMLYKSVHH